MEYDYTPDICGAVLYTSFFFLCAARTRPFIIERVSLTSTDRIKLAFHLSLIASSLLEIGTTFTATSHTFPFKTPMNLYVVDVSFDAPNPSYCLELWVLASK